jgi:putative phosphoserine phosphatase/1-acylglycerol-3-phosphate O-acyltransferase
VSKAHEIGAFFDLDGTLLPSPSLEWRFIGYLLARNEIRGANFARWLAYFAKTVLRDPRAAIETNKFYLAGLRESLAGDWEKPPASNSLPLFVAGIECMAWHLAQGHQVCLISGTLDPLVRVALLNLCGAIIVRATELESRDGVWTGRLGSEHMVGEAKARTVRALSREHDIALELSYAYGNRMTDLAMLESVAFPIAVNPSLRLARRAQKRGWRISHWKEIEPAPSVTHARSIEPTEAR